MFFLLSAPSKFKLHWLRINLLGKFTVSSNESLWSFFQSAVKKFVKFDKRHFFAVESSEFATSMIQMPIFFKASSEYTH